jgi:ribosomal protein L40E
MKVCTKCGEEKPLFEFHKHKIAKDGLAYVCRSCKSAVDKTYRQSAENADNAKNRATKWNRENEERRKLIIQKDNYKRRYGLTSEQKQQLVDGQDGKCAICANDLKDTHDVCVDHNHTTGAIRAILCRKCNLGIGHLQDSIKIVESALEYLKKYS